MAILNAAGGKAVQSNLLRAAARNDAGARAVTHVRSYATHQTTLGTTTTASDKPRHKRVTVFNDDGRVPWGQLSRAEQVARTTQQSFNFTLVIVGGLATAGVGYYLWTDVFSPDSTTSHYNSAVNRVKDDPRCVELLGDVKQITAYGEPSWNRWRRNRPIASRTETDKLGTERLYMHFNMSGPKNDGVVQLFMLRRHDESSYHYGYLALDVKGHSRIYLENAGDQRKKTPGTFLGVRWT